MKRILKLVGILGGIVLVAIIFADDPTKPRPRPTPSPTKADPEWATDVLVMRALRASMHDPKSFEVIQVLRMKDRTLCVTYRARNGFNAIRQEHAVVTQTKFAVTGQPMFSSLWNRHCGGKQGEDISYIRHAI